MIPTKVSGSKDKQFASTYKYTIVRKMPGRGVDQSYRESIGATNKTVTNPFYSLNTAKRPDGIVYQQRIKVPKFRFAENENYHNVKLGDFNGLRITKSVSYNTSTFH